MARDDFPELSAEEYAAFERDMASMPWGPYEPDGQTLDAMKQDAEKDAMARCETIKEMHDYASEYGVDRKVFADSVNGWLSRANDEYVEDIDNRKLALEQDRQIFEENGAAYGEPIPAYEENRLSSSHSSGMTETERQQQIADMEAERRDVLCGAVYDYEKGGGDMSVFSDDVRRVLQGLDYSGYRAQLDGEQQAAQPSPVQEPGRIGALQFDATRKAVPNQESEPAPNLENHKERNHDRLPVRNNYTPGDVTVYNRAIPNDSWSFDEFDKEKDEGPDF